MLRMIVVYHCKEGKREDFHKELCALGARDVSIHEEGNHQYDYYFDAQDLNALLLLEQWDNEATQKAHTTTETFAKLQDLKATYCEGVSIERFEV